MEQSPLLLLWKSYKDFFIPVFGSFGRRLASSVLAMKGRKLLAMSSLQSQKVIFGNSGQNQDSC